MNELQTLHLTNNGGSKAGKRWTLRNGGAQAK